jgi:hypothetical protein
MFRDEAFGFAFVEFLQLVSIDRGHDFLALTSRNISSGAKAHFAKDLNVGAKAPTPYRNFCNAPRHPEFAGKRDANREVGVPSGGVSAVRG